MTGNRRASDVSLGQVYSLFDTSPRCVNTLGCEEYRPTREAEGEIPSNYQEFYPHFLGIRVWIIKIYHYFLKFYFLEIKISQNQIAIYTFTSRQLVNRNIKYLVKKRILIKLKKNVYSVGKVLIKCNGALHPLDVSRSVTDLRCVTERYISNSSNYTNSEKKSFSVDKSKEPKSMVKFWEPGNPDYDRVKNK